MLEDAIIRGDCAASRTPVQAIWHPVSPRRSLTTPVSASSRAAEARAAPRRTTDSLTPGLASGRGPRRPSLFRPFYRPAAPGRWGFSRLRSPPLVSSRPRPPAELREAQRDPAVVSLSSLLPAPCACGPLRRFSPESASIRIPLSRSLTTWCDKAATSSQSQPEGALPSCSGSWASRSSNLTSALPLNA